MHAENKKYQIYLNGELIPVTEEVYKAWYRPIWRTYKFARRHNQCTCPQWHLCEGDCNVCQYQKLGDHSSLDLMFDDSLQQLEAQNSDPEEIVLDAMSTEELLHTLDEIDPYGSRIAKCLLNKADNRDASETLGLAKSTYSDKKMKIRRELRKRKISKL